MVRSAISSGSYNTTVTTTLPICPSIMAAPFTFYYGGFESITLLTAQVLCHALTRLHDGFSYEQKPANLWL